MSKSLTRKTVILPSEIFDAMFIFLVEVEKEKNSFKKTFESVDGGS